MSLDLAAKRGRPSLRRLPDGAFRELCRYCGTISIWRIPEALPICCEEAEVRRVGTLCATVGCRNEPEPKDPWCLECQLAGRTGEPVTPCVPQCLDCRSLSVA